MTAVVSVMDRDSFAANTDVIVVADPERRTLLWVPRDLWCDGLGDRINRAFALGGHAGLSSALAEHGIRAEHGVCLQPAAIDAGLDGLEVTVPVRERLEFWYPRERKAPIEEGRTRVVFEPPNELLSGERIHQWIGARYRVALPGSDLERIERQKTLVTVLLLTGFDFGRFVRSDLPVQVSGREAIDELSLVAPGWSLETLPRLVPAEIDGMKVLVSRDRRPGAPPARS